MIGGTERYVEVDEAKIGKRKHNKGQIIEGQWIMGGIERGAPNNCFIVPVSDRSSETLHPAIK